MYCRRLMGVVMALTVWVGSLISMLTNWKKRVS
jgi:hypothetical protein